MMLRLIVALSALIMIGFTLLAPWGAVALICIVAIIILQQWED